MRKNNYILNHLDYKNEVAHLEGTISEMKKAIDKLVSQSNEMRSKQRKLFKFKDEVSMMDLNVYSDLQKFNSKKIQDLESALDSPYFGRVDFKEDNNDEFESLYIGKTSFGLGQNLDRDSKYRVIDWRMPIASVFYECENGRATYKTKTGNYSGEVKLKRQYTIKNSQLISFVDDVAAAKIAKTLEKLEKAASKGQKLEESKKIPSREQMPEELEKVASKGQKPEELEKVIARKQKHEKLKQAVSREQKQQEVDAISDPVLLERLKQHSDKKLRDIIETIRAEQNRIIRQPLNKVLVVQGVAGSGKSTVGLHRISYLLYNHPNIEPEKILVVAPNKVFLDYIIDLLPGLDAKGVKQLTFEQLALDILGIDLNILEDEKVEFFLSADQKPINQILKDAMVSVSKFKGSLLLIKLIERIINKKANEIIRNLKNISLFDGKLTITRDEQAKYIESSAPLNNRIETLKKAVEFKVELFIKKETYFSYNTAKMKELKKGAVQFLNSYFYKLKPMEPVALYRELFEDENIYKKLYKNRYFSFVAQYTLKLLESGYVERDDLAALCYINHLTDGISPGQKYAHIFADEAQDLSLLEFVVLQLVSLNNSLTIMGDMNQGINSHRGIKNWEQLINSIYGKLKPQYFEILNSYRSTREIVEFSNKLIPGDLPKAKPVARSGEKPVIEKVASNREGIEKIIKLVKHYQDKGCRSIGILAKKEKDCRAIYSALAKFKNKSKLKNRSKSGNGSKPENEFKNINLIDGTTDKYSGGISIVPIVLSKGLEFDAVILWDASDENFSNSDFDLKLLYVAVTRPMHYLHILYKGNITAHLKKLV